VALSGVLFYNSFTESNNRCFIANIQNNYMTIQGWMSQELKLKGNDLMVFALIFGFCQDGESEFKGSINYICNWLNCSRNTVSKSLELLVSNNLIEKRTIFVNNVTFNRYKISLHGVQKLRGGSAETAWGGSAETAHHNTNIDTTIDNIFFNSEKEKNNLETEKENNIYSTADFLEDWKKARLVFENKPTNIVKLERHELVNFNEILKHYNREQVKDGMRGLFMQKTIFESLKVRPTHFLDNFEKYLNAKTGNIQLYASEKDKIKQKLSL